MGNSIHAPCNTVTPLAVFYNTGMHKYTKAHNCKQRNRDLGYICPRSAQKNTYR